MKNPNTIENLVLFLLQESTDARNDVMKLYLMVCKKYYRRNDDIDIGSLSFAVIMNSYKELKLPHFETVRRCRAKLQSKHSELAPTEDCARGRRKCEQMYKAYATK